MRGRQYSSRGDVHILLHPPATCILGCWVKGILERSRAIVRAAGVHLEILPYDIFGNPAPANMLD